MTGTLPDFIGKERLVAENENYNLYSNDLTRDCTKKARAMDINGMELRGWTVLKVVPKNNPDRTFYVIFDKEGNPYRDTQNIWDMYDWIKIKKVAMSYDYDIVNIAEKLNTNASDTTDVEDEG